MKQAPITSSLYLALFLLWCGIGVLVFIKLKKMIKDAEEVELTIIMALVFIFIVVFAIAMLSQAPMVFAGFFNPEYWALKQLIPK